MLAKAVRILVVTPFMWSGAGKAIVRLAGALQGLGHDLCVVSSGESKGLTDWPGYVDQLKAARIPYHQVDFFDRSPEVVWTSVDRLAASFKPSLPT
jgi:hypothetical protein